MIKFKFKIIKKYNKLKNFNCKKILNSMIKSKL